MPRTATTFFQTRFFPQLPDISYYGLPYTQINPAFNRMLFEDESMFQPAVFRNELEGLSGEKILLSNENFVGQSLYLNYSNRTSIAHRLHDAMPGATVILFLRNQSELLKSLYLISLQDRETASLSEFIRFDPPEYTLQQYRLHPKVDLFDYAPFDTYHASEYAAGYRYTPLLELYTQLFPRVEIFLYEDFRKNPESVFRRLETVFETTIPDDVRNTLVTSPAINQGVNARQAEQLRRLNRWYHVLWNSRAGRAFFVRARRRILKNSGAGDPVNWKKEELEKLKLLFAADNKLLQERYPHIGLDKYAREYFL